ncbi:MAG: hypothetical protein RL223_1081 [Pseudomonadota bacterium]
MKALDIKLWRDLRLMWSQALTIALVVAVGIGGFLMCLSAVHSLERARDDFYAEAHFADLFATVKRAPRSLVAPLLATPGVADVQPGIEQIVRISQDGSSDPALGRLIGLDPRVPRRLDQVRLVEGRWPADGGGRLEALVSRGFAQARGLAPGSQVSALVNGRQRRLHIVGIALSPEYIFAGLFGSPDQRGFGVFWLDEDALAAAWDMAGAFNTLAVRLAPGGARDADGVLPGEAAAIRALSAPLRRYGGAPPYGREHQASHQMLDSEIRTQRLLGTVLPLIFLAVAAFLINVVVSRLVATQREQIAALKALGYGDAQIAGHYLKLVAVIIALGALGGVALGHGLGRLLLGLYAQNFHFPRLVLHVPAALVALSCGLTLAAALGGTLSAILATVRLSPAAAMRPPAPGRYGPTLAERLGWRRLSPGLRMILRNLERRPWRSAVSVIGVAAAVAIVMMGHFFRDAIDGIVDTEFGLKMRSDVSVWLTEADDAGIDRALARLPGVLAVEPTRFLAVTLRHGHRAERVQLRAGPADPALYRIVDLDGQAQRLPGDGLVLTDRLADKLGVRPGQPLLVELDSGPRRSLVLGVDGTVREAMGLNAYARLDAFNRATGEPPALASGYTVTLLPGSEPRFLEATRGLPAISGAFSKASMLRNMQEVTARNLLIMSGMLTVFAAVIAVGVVYNNARIALAERAWELASLRVLGFSQGEVSWLLLGEQALLIALALPLGLLAGLAMVHGTAAALTSDQFHFPAIVQPRTAALAVLTVLLAAAGTAAIVRRRIARIDMVSALKTRE